MLSDEDIHQLAPRLSIPLAGIYFKDQLPRSIESGKLYMINIQNEAAEDGSPNPGTHWTGFILIGGIPFYFDSFGFPAPKELVDRIGQKIAFNCRQIQSIDYSAACGWYVLAWAHFMLSTNPRFNADYFMRYNDFVSLFDPENQFMNDQILKQFFRAKPGPDPPANTAPPE